MKRDPKGLPNLSPRTGHLVRTNSESLIGVISGRRDVDLSEGVAISSIYHTDEHSHIEPVRYGAGSGFFRLLMAAHAPADTLARRAALTLKNMAADPKGTVSAWSVPDMAKYSQVLLFMRTLEGTLEFQLGRGLRTGLMRGLRTRLSDGSPPPLAFMEEATALARRFADKTDGFLVNLVTEAISGVPSTAHILGGACIGPNPSEGVIDGNHEVYGYKGLYVADGSAMSANPGVNPSLTITAMAERAMARIPERNAP
jgi:cholesterol oxidase